MESTFQVKQVYSYFNDENIYCGFEYAYESPLEPGVFPLPAKSTEIEPLESKEGFSVVFNESLQCWEYVEDHRGEVWYDADGNKVSNIKLGDPVDPTWVSELPPPKEGYSIFYNFDLNIWEYIQNRPEFKFGYITEYDDVSKEWKYVDDWTQIRSRRDQLLSKSDWTRLDDVNLNEQQKSDWQEYRQNLRDIPNAYSKVEDIVWPTEP